MANKKVHFGPKDSRGVGSVCDIELWIIFKTAIHDNLNAFFTLVKKDVFAMRRAIMESCETFL